MTTKFEYAINFTLRWEAGVDKSGKIREDGGYNDYDGSPTKWGIRSAANPGVDIKALTKEAAIEIYRNKYWNTINADSYELGLAVVMFDTGVNCGPGRAKEWVQKLQGEDIAKRLIEKRNIYYLDLRMKDPKKYGPYIRGWMARTNDLNKYVDIIRLESTNPASPAAS